MVMENNRSNLFHKVVMLDHIRTRSIANHNKWLTSSSGNNIAFISLPVLVCWGCLDKDIVVWVTWIRIYFFWVVQAGDSTLRYSGTFFLMRAHLLLHRELSFHWVLLGWEENFLVSLFMRSLTPLEPDPTLTSSFNLHCFPSAPLSHWECRASRQGLGVYSTPQSLCVWSYVHVQYKQNH